MKKKWVKLANGKLALSVNGFIMATVSDKAVECMGATTHQNHFQTEELAMKFAEEQCSRLAVSYISAALEGV